MARPELFQSICDFVGPATCKVIAVDTGWPGIVEITALDGTTHSVALHASLVGSHSRKAYERRFQNPATKPPVVAPGIAIPILVGLAFKGLQPILVAIDGRSRVGRVARFSILFHEDLVAKAASEGWAEYVSHTGEHIFAMHPKLLGIFVQSMIAGVFPDSRELARASSASGIVDDDDEASADRARRVALTLVRDARFGKDVKDAYNDRCAMCDLSLGLVVGAHIFPVSAAGSVDKVWNGVALCQNHHAAFDKHYIWIDPDSYEVKLKPEIIALATTDEAVETFRHNTKPLISVPGRAALRPRPTMFERRYLHYHPFYEWA
ncbi:MAG: HNH endonuclease [Bradyrhizobium sp.]|uniref:HNH endonuclease n=1 Tax=Bradyrhizobium sp. TaxID=376 RepID=UPI002731B86F|nr:HNH endonuclease [Bradyrhizobium sp.]MDP1868480.1 HNH endonuclease [Bradyrhizobium sp.]